MLPRQLRTQMNSFVFKRTVAIEPLLIHLLIEADLLSLDDSDANEIASLVSTMDITSEDVDEPIMLARRIFGLFKNVKSVEVVDEDGDGAIVSEKNSR